VTLLCLDGPQAGLVCDEPEFAVLAEDESVSFTGVPEGYFIREAEDFEGLHYPASLIYQPTSLEPARDPVKRYPRG
jgi:hypothetical protein